MADNVVIDCPMPRSARLNLVGVRFGRLLVVSEAKPRKRPGGQTARYWVCTCDCGQTVEACTGQLRSSHTFSCGCAAADATRARNFRHGAASRKGRTPEYVAWKAIRSRCREGSARPDAHLYAGRGITVAPEWDDFTRFMADMGPRPSPKHSLDRIDNNGNYEPGNCRWATASQQRRNQRSYIAKHGEAA